MLSNNKIWHPSRQAVSCYQANNVRNRSSNHSSPQPWSILYIRRLGLSVAEFLLAKEADASLRFSEP
jgi:hypothetical protein